MERKVRRGKFTDQLQLSKFSRRQECCFGYEQEQLVTQLEILWLSHLRMLSSGLWRLCNTHWNSESGVTPWLRYLTMGNDLLLEPQVAIWGTAVSTLPSFCGCHLITSNNFLHIFMMNPKEEIHVGATCETSMHAGLKVSACLRFFKSLLPAVFTNLKG